MYSFGIDVGGTKINMGLLDGEGKIIYEIPEFCGCYIDPSRGSLIVKSLILNVF